MRNAKPKIILAVILILAASFPVMAQEDGGDPDYEQDWDVYSTDIYTKGDQIFVISLGTVFPVLFTGTDRNTDEKGKIDLKFTPPVGGTGLLSYLHYLHPRFFLGGEISGFFIRTQRENTMFVVPLGVVAGTQFIVKRFEFPIALSLGMAWHTYINNSYFGFYMKAAASAYFRIKTNWSFGITTAWSWYPEWIKDEKKHNVNGHFVRTMVSARYHF